MRNKRFLASLVLACALSSAFAAVTRDFPQRELVVNVSAGMPDWRPHRAYNADEAQILTAVCEGLFVYDPLSMDPVPALAESWTVSKDGLSWTFTVRGDAKYGNGEPITAQEIAESWFTLLDPSLSAPYASLLDCVSGAAAYREGKTSDKRSVGIVAADKRTLVVKLVSPAEHLPKVLCHHAFSAVHRDGRAEALARTRKAGFVPVSSGAFVVSKITDGEILFARNPHYWDAAKVALPSIRVVLSDDPDDLTARFNRGEIHWLAGSTRVDRILDRSSILLTPLFATEYFFFRATWGPWADARVRNALLAAVPWKELRADYVIPAKTLVFPISGYPELPGLTEQDVDKAKKLLAEAGVDNPSALPVLEIRVPDGAAFAKIAGILETAWTGLGLSVVVRAIPYDGYYPTLREDTYAVGITTWIGDFADPLSFLEMFRPGSTLNDSGWNSPEFERLILDASNARDKKERYDRLAKAETLLLEQGLIAPVAHNPALNVIDTNGLEGWYSNALDIHPFKFIRFGPKKPLPGVASAK